MRKLQNKILVEDNSYNAFRKALLILESTGAEYDSYSNEADKLNFFTDILNTLR